MWLFTEYADPQTMFYKHTSLIIIIVCKISLRAGIYKHYHNYFKKCITYADPQIMIFFRIMIVFVKHSLWIGICQNIFENCDSVCKKQSLDCINYDLFENCDSFVFYNLLLLLHRQMYVNICNMIWRTFAQIFFDQSVQLFIYVYDISASPNLRKYEIITQLCNIAYNTQCNEYTGLRFFNFFIQCE